MPLLIIILLALTILANFVLGLMVLMRSYRRPYGWYFALTLLGVSTWALGDGIMLLADTRSVVNAGALLFYVGPTIIPLGILLFSLAYPDNHKLTNWGVSAIGAVFLLWAAAFIFIPDVFIKEILIASPLNTPVLNYPGFLLYAAHFSVFFLATYVVLYRKVARFTRLAKTQLMYTFVGVITASLLAMITNLSLPIMGVQELIWLGPVLTLIFVGAVSYAIIRHQLFDIRLVVARALGYVFSLVALASMYGLFIFSGTWLVFGTQIDLWTAIFISAATGIAALAFARLKAFFDRFTNSLFFRDVYNPQELFAALNRILVSSIDLNYLLKHVTDLLADSLKVEFCIVGLESGATSYRLIGTHTHKITSDDAVKVRRLTSANLDTVIVTEALEGQNLSLRKLLLKYNIHALVQISHDAHGKQEGLGYIILGGKKSGNSFNNQDIQVLDTIANELVIAIQNALRFEQIESFNSTLQNRIEEATRELRRTNNRLKTLDETKDDFISMASHQLRTPLTSVKGYISMVLEGDAGKLTPLQRSMLDQAFVSSQRMVFLIADLLNISRLKTGKFIIDRSQIDLAQMVEDEVHQLMETARSRDLELTYDKPDKFPTVFMDETKTRQVIMNFIDNAIYYTPAGGKIKVELLDTPDTIQLKVTDNGIGVPKTEQPHLFTKFYRAGNARRARPDGTGLGLFMAKKVIVAQGGAILFDSKENMGSTFGFAFSKDKVLIQ